MVLFDVVNDWDGNEIAHAHLASQEKPNLGAADIVLNELLDHIDVVLPWLQRRQSLVNIGAAAFHDERLNTVS